jgi:hypothetical protein
MIQLSPRDIIDSVGILYYDKYDTLSDNNYPIPEHLKDLKLSFSKYLILYLSNGIKNRKQLIDYIMCRFIYQLNLSGTQKQDILIEFYLIAFNFNIESDISLLFKNIDLRPFNTQKEEIEGCTAAITNKKEKTGDQIIYEQNQNYASEITSQIKL